MKKHLALSIALLIQSGLVSEAIAAQMIPNTTYQTNPLTGMTQTQRNSVQNAFKWAVGAFQQNHRVCRNRGECLSLDLQSLTNYIQAYPRYPATGMFKKLYNIIHHDSMHQKFVSQWVIFKNLSQERQNDYMRGLRITPVTPQNAVNSAGALAPAYFNQDDVLTDLLQQVDHHHKNCEQYITCLRGDLQIINNMYNRLNVNDPVRTSLASLSKIISTLSSTKIFNDMVYLDIYNPFSSNWYDINKKYKAGKHSAFGYQEWKYVERSSRAVAWLRPRFTNGTVYQVQQPQPAPTGSFRSYVEGIRGKTQNETGKVKSWGKRMEDVFKDNKDLLKSWW